ncbi:MAG: DHH family phosphoesterase [Zavarzinella sp.]
MTFISHVQPDPDSIGSMLGLSHLVESTLGIPTRITRDGLINRAENRAMVELLDVDMDPVEKLDYLPDEAVVMVDSQPKTGRHSIDCKVRLYGVIDHHNTPGDLQGIPFIDLRPSLGATCTIVTRYLLEQRVSVPEKIATALYYGIETEVGGYPREATQIDDGALHFLFPLANKDLLAQIRNAKLSHGHFEVLLNALQCSTIYDRLMISWMSHIHQPEQVAEVVDFMVRFEKVDWALCGGIYQGKLLLSLRTSIHNVQAGDLLRKVVGDLGKAGGHDRRAGGCIPLPADNPGAACAIQEELRRRMIKELNIHDHCGERLVPLRELLQKL